MQSLALFVAALAVLFAYVQRARRVPEPIIRPALFADPAFAVPNVMNVLASLAGFSILLLTPYYLVNVLKLSALASGVVLALAFVGSLAGAPLVGLAGRADRPAADRLCRHRVVGLGLLPLAFTGRRHARAPGGVAADRSRAWATACSTWPTPTS